MNESVHNVSVEPGAEHAPHAVHLPAPTAWPILLALGLMLVFASLLMNPMLGVLGGVLSLVSAVGWFRDVLPAEKHVDIPTTEEEIAHVPQYDRVAKFAITEEHRALLPQHSFSIASGVLGGIIGGIAMVIPAEIYGVMRYHSIWYVVNLLGGAGIGDWINPTPEQLTHFRLGAFVIANMIQGVTTLLVGVLYGALLPAFPKRPILLGGILAPALWTGLLYSVIGLVNPFLQARIDWLSFAASQVVFGVVAGYVVMKHGQIKELSTMPLAVRMGVEASGLHHHDSDGGNH
ncbi:MAG: hypothetical protein PW735_09915 [Acidobacteriaceae bacterium]|nr:hypothetical protein [Acidobacteriaceae bacterium]